MKKKQQQQAPQPQRQHHDPARTEANKKHRIEREMRRQAEAQEKRNQVIHGASRKQRRIEDAARRQREEQELAQRIQGEYMWLSNPQLREFTYHASPTICVTREDYVKAGFIKPKQR